MKHTYWGIGWLASWIAAIGCMICITTTVWPENLIPYILMFLFILLADMCAHRIVEKGQQK